MAASRLMTCPTARVVIDDMEQRGGRNGRGLKVMDTRWSRWLLTPAECWEKKV